VVGGRASSHDSKKRGLLDILLFLANTFGTAVGTPTPPGTSLFKFPPLKSLPQMAAQTEGDFAKVFVTYRCQF
jgi:hypothetical protein